MLNRNRERSTNFVPTSRRPLLGYASSFLIAALGAQLGGLASGGAAFAGSDNVEVNGQKMMPIPDGVALSWKVDCFWGEPISYGGKSFRAMGYANGQMINFMDIEASYWPARFKLAPGEKLVLTGYFPHARYSSINSYGGGAPTSSLVDVDIEPDAGSKNPFRQGARRDTPDDQRRYTIYVINEPEPTNKADRAPNTLYARPAAEPYDIVELRYRTYLVDQTPQNAFDQRGGVPLPTPVKLILVGGSERPGAALCERDRAMAQKMFFRAIPPEHRLVLVAGLSLHWQDAERRILQ